MTQKFYKLFSFPKQKKKKKRRGGGNRERERARFFPLLFTSFWSFPLQFTILYFSTHIFLPLTGPLLYHVPLYLLLPATCSSYYFEPIDSHYAQRTCLTASKWRQGRHTEGAHVQFPSGCGVDPAPPSEHSCPQNPHCSRQLFPISRKWNLPTGRFCVCPCALLRLYWLRGEIH